MSINPVKQMLWTTPPEDFETVAVWLASRGSSYVTGLTFAIGGGYSVF